MRSKTKHNGTLIGFLFILQITSFAQCQTDLNSGMKINVPDDWTKEGLYYGTNQVYDFYRA